MPKISSYDLFKRLRTYASKYGCWTNKYSDNELLERCQEFIEQSQKEEKFSKENNITYLDTSFSTDCLLEYVKNMKIDKKINYKILKTTYDSI